MTKIRSSILLKKLIVHSAGEEVYSQEFHRGLNVIRGEHAVGKTTIAELIFYILGGEIKKEQWLYPAKECDYVYADFDFNGNPFCLKREILPGSVPAIEIFSNYYDYGKGKLDGWIVLGSRRNHSKYSFSQEIFELLGWEHHKTDDYANLTMHQILRMLYVDQETGSDKIFRGEAPTHDSETMRLAIAEFLLGLDDLEAHKIRQDLLIARRQLDKSSDEFDAIIRVLGQDSTYKIEDLEKDIANLYEDIISLDEQKMNIMMSQSMDEDDGIDEKIMLQVNQLNAEMSEIIDMMTQDENAIIELTNEIIDCKNFKISIDFRKKSLLESQSTFEQLGSVEFKFCPSCLAPIETDTTGCCQLCKSSKRTIALNNSYLEILTELQFHDKQNSHMIETFEISLREIQNRWKNNEKKLRSKRQSLRKILRYTKEREEKLNNLSREIGFIEAQIKTLMEKTDIIQQLDLLRSKIDETEALISKLVRKQEELNQKNQQRRQRIMNNLSKTALSILEQDLDYEDIFKKASQYDAEIDFAKDRWLIDGRAKFSGSSNVLKKNALHLACFLESLKDDKFRYPRFLIIDDIENGGMVKERSQNFQNIILEKLPKDNTEYQLIIATAMISEKLNNSQYGVGPYYKKGDHIIKIKTLLDE